MIRNIVLDMGNVLLEYNPQVPLDLFCKTEEEKQTIRKELFEGPEWVQGDLGNITYEGKFESISRRIPEHMHAALKRCIYEWDVCMKRVKGAKEFCEYAKRKGFRLYVLSNAATDFYRYFPNFAPFDYFDGIVVSADVHVIKPDERIYRHLLDTYGLIPEECLFIDDLETNVAGARRAGMLGTVFRGDFEEVKEIIDSFSIKRGIRDMDLDQIRREIDEIDGRLRDLFLQRMDLSLQVIEQKKKTGAAVYAPGREMAVLSARTSGVSDEYLLECETFFRQIMGISRTYQYSKIAGGEGRLKSLPRGAGEVTVRFLCKSESGHLAACLNAAALAGLMARQVTAEEKGESCICQVCLAGDFSTALARAAVLQMLEENEDAGIVNVKEV